MPGSPSSIFSSETLVLRPRGKGTRRALLVAFAVCLTAELVCRLAFAPVGGFWEFWDREAAAKFEHYRRSALAGETAELVIVGDSTAARDFAPEMLPGELSSRVYNLGWPADFPLAFELLNLTLFEPPYAVPARVVLSFNTAAMLDYPLGTCFEAAIKSCAFCRRAVEGWHLGDVLWMTRTTAMLPWRTSWFSGENLPSAPPESGYLPLEGRALRQPRATWPGEYPPLDRQRLEVVRRLAELLQGRSSRLLVVLPPRRPSRAQGDFEMQYLAFLRGLAEEGLLEVLDLREPAGLQPEHYYDPWHLNREGAALLAQIIAPRLERFLDGP